VKWAILSTSPFPEIQLLTSRRADRANEPFFTLFIWVADPVGFVAGKEIRREETTEIFIKYRYRFLLGKEKGFYSNKSAGGHSIAPKTASANTASASP